MTLATGALLAPTVVLVVKFTSVSENGLSEEPPAEVPSNALRKVVPATDGVKKKSVVTEVGLVRVIDANGFEPKGIAVPGAPPPGGIVTAPEGAIDTPNRVSAIAHDRNEPRIMTDLLFLEVSNVIGRWWSTDSFWTKL